MIIFVNLGHGRGTKFRFFYARFVNNRLCKAFLAAIVSAAFIIYVGCGKPRSPVPSVLSPEEAREVWARYGPYFPKGIAVGEWTRDGVFEYAEGAAVKAFLGEAGVAYGCSEAIYG